MTEVLISLRGQCLAAQSVFSTGVFISLIEQMYAHLGMKTISVDDNIDRSYSYHLKVTLLKGYEYSTIQISQDLNNLVISITKYMQLYFIKFYYDITSDKLDT